jgi:hypothetical protein
MAGEQRRGNRTCDQSLGRLGWADVVPIYTIQLRRAPHRRGWHNLTMMCATVTNGVPDVFFCGAQVNTFSLGLSD